MIARSQPIPGIRKIAVLRANVLGDLIFVLPALHALRAAYPEAEIVLLAREWPGSLLADRPGPVDRVVAVPLYRGVGEDPSIQEDPEKVAAFFAAMQDEQFDLAIQMHGGGRFSNPFTLRLGAKLTVGMKAPDAVALDRWIPYIWMQSEPLRYAEVVSLVGAATLDLEPPLPVLSRDLDEAKRVVPPGQKPLVAIHPGASDPSRRWPPKKFAVVADALARAGARIVVTGTQPESYLAEAVVASMESPAENVCGRLSLDGLVGLLSRCKVVVSNDSGPLHLARAVGAATVGIFWIGNVVTAAPITRERHRLAISWRIHCPLCGQECTHTRCEHRESFVADVSTEEVSEAALDLLST